jgi:hypothetical protein
MSLCSHAYLTQIAPSHTIRSVLWVHFFPMLQLHNTNLTRSRNRFEDSGVDPGEF